MAQERDEGKARTEGKATSGHSTANETARTGERASRPDEMFELVEQAGATVKRARQVGQLRDTAGALGTAKQMTEHTKEITEQAEEILQNAIGPEIDSILSRLEVGIPEERRAMNAVMARLIRG